MKIAILTGLFFIMAIGLGVFNDEVRGTHRTREAVDALKAWAFDKTSLVPVFTLAMLVAIMINWIGG